MNIKHSLQQLKDNLTLLFREFSDFRKYVVILLTLIVMKQGLEMCLPLLLLPIIDEYVGTASVPSQMMDVLTVIKEWLGLESIVIVTIILLISLSICKSIVSIGYFYLLSFLQFTYQSTRRESLFNQLMDSRWLYFINHRTGDSINSIFMETNRSSESLNACIGVFDGVVLMLFYFIAAAFISASTTFTFIGLILLLGLSTIPLWKILQKNGKAIVHHSQNLMHYFNELLNAIKVVKGCRMEDVGKRIIATHSDQLRKYQTINNVLRHIPTTLLEPLVIIFICLLVFMVRYLSVANISESVVIGVIMYRSIQRISAIQHSGMKFMSYCPSLAVVSKMPETLVQYYEKPASKTIDELKSITFQHVVFNYPSREIPAINKINLKINKGEFVGVVGSSGAGKTTFVDLVLDLVQPQIGDIIVNNTSLKEIDYRNWRSLIGYVPQECILFNDTIRNNITLYREGVQEEDIYWAAKISEADEFIQALPQGYDTMVGDRGLMLSGGQRQRLSLARALAHRPQLLMLDEATSALDTVTERKIQKAVEELKRQFTIIVIAHRLSTVINSDRIYVLDAGSLIEEGSPAELLNAKGYFMDLYSMQQVDG